MSRLELQRNFKAKGSIAKQNSTLSMQASETWQLRCTRQTNFGRKQFGFVALTDPTRKVVSWQRNEPRVLALKRGFRSFLK